MSTTPSHPDRPSDGDAPEAGAEREAASIRETAGRIAAVSQEIRERFHETERLIARADAVHAETERQVHRAEQTLEAAHARVRATLAHGSPPPPDDAPPEVARPDDEAPA